MLTPPGELARGFRQLGGTIVEGVDCKDVVTEGDAVVGLSQCINQGLHAIDATSALSDRLTG